MLTQDLKTIIELMELSGGKFSVVKLDSYKAYSTNGKALVVRDIQIKDQGFINKNHLPMLKAIYAADKINEFVSESLSNYIDETCSFDFPSTEQMDSVFKSEFLYEINFDANDLIKTIKSLKGKDNSIIMKIKDNSSPFMIVHDNGKAIISTKKD